MFLIDVITRVALFLTNVLHLNPFRKKSKLLNYQKPCLAEKLHMIVSLTCELIQSFHCRKYQFYSRLICIDFIAYDKIHFNMKWADLMGNQTICSERTALVAWLLLYNWFRIQDFSTCRIREPLLLAYKKYVYRARLRPQKPLAILKMP